MLLMYYINIDIVCLLWLVDPGQGRLMMLIGLLALT